MTAIGIGIGGEPDKVIRSIAKVPVASDIICYCTQEARAGRADPEGFRISDNPSRSLVGDLVSGRIGAAIRGSLPANETLSALKAATGVDHLERAALLETADGRTFFLAPVGIDEGWTVAEKIVLAGKNKKDCSRVWGCPTGLQFSLAAGSATSEDTRQSTGRWQMQSSSPGSAVDDITRS